MILLEVTKGDGMKKVLGIAAVVVFLVSCLNGLATSILYQYAAANKTPVPEETPEPLKKIDLQTERGNRVHGWYNQNAKFNAPVVVYFHGNGENVQTVNQSGLLEKVRSLGAHAVAFDFPKYGLSTGEPSQETVIEGAQAVYDHLKAIFPQSKIILWGRSLGCGPATIMAANNPDTAKLILTSPWNSFWKLVKIKGNLSDSSAKNAAKGNEYETEVHATKVHMPVLIHHGTKDSVIPWEMGREVSEAFASPDVSFVSIEGADHNNLIGEREWAEIGQFIRY